MKKIELPRDDQIIIDRINDILDLNVGWSNQINKINEDHLQEFRNIANHLIDTMQSRNDLTEMMVVTSTLDRLGNELPAEHLFPTDSKQNQTKIKNIESVKKSIDKVIFTGNIGDLEIETKAQRAFPSFLTKEKSILASVGLNQASIAVIIPYLDKFRNKICQNIGKRLPIKYSSIDRSLDSARRQLNQDLKTKRKQLYLPTSSLESSRNKIIGIATLIGDTLPFFYGKNLDFAAYMSTVAGATVSVILPSYDRK